MVNFDAAPNKTAKIKLDTNAHLESRSDLNVAFSTGDQDTAILRFNVTQDYKPLFLGESNIDSNIYLKHSNGSHISHPLTITDSLTGELSFQIPNDFVKIPGKVTAQVYVARKGASQAIVAERIFSFTIQESLAWEFDAETKLAYIIEFNELREHILNRQKEIEDAMANAVDYVTQLEQATTDGLNALNNLVNAKTVEYNDNHADKLALINNTVDGYVQDFLDQRSYIDTKYAEFRTAVGGSGLVTTGSAANWQKYKLTLDNGDIPFKVGFDFNDINGSGLKSGFYIVSNGINAPVGVSNYGYLRLLTSGSNYAEATYRPYNTDKVYVAYKWSSATEWTPFTTPTQNMETLTGSQSKANVAENNAKVYADSKIDEQHAVLFSGSVNGVDSSINLTSSLYDYNMIVISGSYYGGTIHETVLPAAIGPNVIIQRLNLANTDGAIAFAYEMSIDVISGTKLTIARDVSYDMSNQLPSGPNNSAFTITRIEGFK